MAAWQLTSEDLKRYPHFDSWLSIEDAKSLATDPNAVATHTFYPFMLYKNRWTRFAAAGEAGDVKERPIRYSARGDAYIYILTTDICWRAPTKRLYRKLPCRGRY